MSILDSIYRSIMNINVGSHKGEDFNPNLNNFIDDLKKKGYVYNDIRDWWERTWTTNEGKESIQEIYKQDNDGWKKLMIGYDDNIFYEERINES